MIPFYSALLVNTINSIAIILLFPFFQDFPSSSAGNESTCNAEDPGWIPGSGRSAGEGICWRSPTPVFLGFLVAQLVKNLPAMWVTWVGKVPCSRK